MVDGVLGVRLEVGGREEEKEKGGKGGREWMV